jgi:pilus assembly protein CpaC
LIRFARAFAVAASLALVGTSPALAQRKTSSDATEELEEIDLAVGENRTVPATDVRNYSEGSPGIVDVKLTTDATQFVVVGLKPGQTTLLLIHKDGTRTNYSINVFSRSPVAVEKELQQLLEGTVGLRIRRVGARFFIEGGVSSEADQKRLSHIAALYPGQVESLVEVGSLADDRQFNIRVDFYFVQFNRDSGYQVGILWPARIGGDGVITNSVTYDFVSRAVSTATASITNQPLPALDIAARRGWAKVLKQATIITGNGAEAHFDSGGEQNFTVATNFTANIHPITFGIDLVVLPRFDRTTHDMEVKISAENNDLVPPSGSSNLPGRDRASLSTIVHLKLGQSIVLSGISSRTQRHAVTGLPLLSDIPVLGILFGSHQDAATDVEGAVLIIPSVIESLPRASLDGVRRALTQYEEFSGKIKPIDFINKTPPVVDQPPSDPPPVPSLGGGPNSNNGSIPNSSPKKPR